MSWSFNLWNTGLITETFEIQGLAYTKTCFFSVNKPLNQCLGASPKTFLPHFSSFGFFFTFFIQKCEKAYSDQHLKCAAPKHWKFTTIGPFSSK